jgi:probable F420-dependent oxidoreductase
MPEPRWGLTVPFPGVPLAAQEPLVRRAEAAGFQDLWSAETNGADAFTPLALAAAWTERMRLGTGIAGVFTRGPALLAMHAAALADASEGRFVLGIGSSSDVIVERWNGIPFARPRTKVRETLEALRPILRGDRGPGGFRLETPPAHAVPVYVAALRERMLRLAGEQADGTFVNFLPVSAAERVVGTIGAPPEHDVVCRFFCLARPEEEALPQARQLLAAYATVPVYEAFFRWLGWGEAIDPLVAAWRAGDRRLAVERVPDDLVREVFLFGDGDAMRERLAAFADAGITSLCLDPVGPPEHLAAFIDALAPR